MNYDEKILRRNSGELAKKIRDLNYKKLQLISLGNSIGTGFSLSDINLPLLERDKILDEEMKKEEITLEKYRFARSENNSDEHIFNWILNNISQSEVDKWNYRDYLNHISNGNELIKKDMIKDIYNGKNNIQIKDLLFNQEDNVSDIVIYNGATGSFLDNITRKGKHKLTYGITKDLDYIDAILGMIQNSNRKTNSTTQVYICGAPKITNIPVSDFFINRKLKSIVYRYSNVSYVPNFHKKMIYNKDGKIVIDMHYDKEEYLLLISNIFKTINDNVVINNSIIKIDKKLSELNENVEINLSKENTTGYVLDLINKEATNQKDKILFLNEIRNYLLERYPYDFSSLDYETIKNLSKILS